MLSAQSYIKKYKLPLIITGIILLLGVMSFFIFSFFNDTHTIILKADGFHPSTLTIQEGDTVVFKSKVGFFWPASNVHPTHTGYPDFDPRKPVAPDDSWEFTFTEAGTYGFHDHINAIHEGVIIVTSASGDVPEVDCESERTSQCWERLILSTLEKDGIKAAFDILVYLSDNEPLFTTDCHGYAHLIGDEAYALYAADENFELSPATALCGYGFYHGFMETLLLTTGNLDEARAFCEEADKKLAGQVSAASTACYHGTGHGAVDGSNPGDWGDIEAMMAPGFRLCDKLAENDLQLYLCNTGVFNAIEILSHNPEYKITYIHDDPYAFCNEQILERREACYSNMIPLVMQKFNNDFEQVLSYINERMIDADELTIDDLTINEMVTLGAMFEFIRLHGGEPDYAERGISLCREQPEEDQLPCIEGLSGGHIKYGPPGKGYVKNLAFCEHDMLTKEERDACYRYTLPRMGAQYNQETQEKICAQVEQPYREKYCKF